MPNFWQLLRLAVVTTCLREAAGFLRLLRAPTKSAQPILAAWTGGRSQDRANRSLNVASQAGLAPCLRARKLRPAGPFRGDNRLPFCVVGDQLHILAQIVGSNPVDTG